MNNPQIIELTHKYVMNTYGRQPLALVRGEGSRAWDADGKEYLDFVTGVAVNSLGHCHPKVVAAIKEASETLLHCSNHYYIADQAKLAEFLTRKSGMGKAFFCNSGAEAVEAAIKLARRYAKRFVGEERFEIVAAWDSFHGRTMAAITATGQPKYHQGFEPLVPGFIHIPLNDIKALQDAVGAKTAGVLLEPIQGEGGVHPCSPEFLQEARRLCDKEGIPLILDEVQTGLGRTGKWFGFQHYDVQPDIITLAKALGGGVPIGSTLATDRVAQGFEPGSHASTFGGNPFVTHVALAAMQAMDEEGLVEKAAATGDYIKIELKRMAARYPTVLGEVRGAGCLMGVELKVPGAEVIQEAREQGLLINVAGGQVLRLVPPLNVSQEDMDAALQIIEEILRRRA